MFPEVLGTVLPNYYNMPKNNTFYQKVKVVEQYEFALKEILEKELQVEFTKTENLEQF